MKTLLIVFAIFALLGMVMFILIHEHKKANEELSKPDSDATEIIGEDESEVDESEVDIAVPEDTDESEPEPEEEYEPEPEVNIPEHCKPQEDPFDTLLNKYFFNIHKYTTAKNRTIYCVVCNAVINGKNYKIIVRNSFYPYIRSYTKNLCIAIASKYSDTMSVEEFLKTGSTKFDRVGEIVYSLPYVH